MATTLRYMNLLNTNNQHVTHQGPFVSDRWYKEIFILGKLIRWKLEKKQNIAKIWYFKHS